MNWIWLLLALLAVAVLVWWLWPTPLVEEPALVTDEELEPLPAEPMEPTAPAPAVEPTATILVVDIIGDPTAWVGRTVQGEAQVAEVPTDRGFWIGEGDSRLFVVLDEQGDEVPVDVNADMTLQIQAAEVRSADDIDEVSGNLDPQTREILQTQEIFLTVDDDDLVMPGEAGAATGDTAGTSAGQSPPAP